MHLKWMSCCGLNSETCTLNVFHFALDESHVQPFRVVTRLPQFKLCDHQWKVKLVTLLTWSISL